jgi:hypothetical protein
VAGKLEGANMETLKYILKKYDLDSTQFLLEIPLRRHIEYPILLKELGLKKGVEIGVYRGEFAEVLKKAIPDLDLIGVDPWIAYEGYNCEGGKPEDLETVAYGEAKARAEKFDFKIMKAWSVDAVKEFADESLDFVFIDGNHDFEHVVEDVAKWSRKVRKGGLVSGHDFLKKRHKGYGVREAIPAWCECNNIKPLFALTKDSYPSWFYVKS